MSDPTDLYYCVSVGFGSNHRKLALERLIGERANFIPQALWSYAALNQRDGNFSTYGDEDYLRIFQSWGVRLKLATTKRIVAALKKTGFIDQKGHLHSWRKYNDFFFSSHQRKAVRVRWRKERQRQREQDREAAKLNGNGHAPRPSPLFRQIESAEKLLADCEAKLKKLPVPNRLIDEEGYSQVCKKRSPLVEEKSQLVERIKQLRKEESGT